jgi:hypothetical protein
MGDSGEHRNVNLLAGASIRLLWASTLVRDSYQSKKSGIGQDRKSFRRTPLCQSFGCPAASIRLLRGINISLRLFPEQEIRHWTGLEIIQENAPMSIFWLSCGFNPFATWCQHKSEILPWARNSGLDIMHLRIYTYRVDRYTQESMGLDRIP